MNRYTTPRSPFSTPLSGSAKETEDRIRNIFQYKKKRPPLLLLALACVLALTCGGLVSCEVEHSVNSLFAGTEEENHTVSYSLSLTSTRSLILELHSDNTVQSNTLFPLRELLVYEGDTLLQTISTQELTAGSRSVRAYDWRTGQVEAYPISSLTEEAQYLYEGLFFGEEPALDGQEFGDFNFDGYTDFALPVFSASPRNTPYAFFLWDPGIEEYVFSFLMFAPVTLDEENQLLMETTYDSSITQTRQYTFDEDGLLCTIQDEPVPYSGSAKIAQAFSDVMLGMARFTLVRDQLIPCDLSQLNEMIWNDSEMNVYAEQFAVADLDADGIPEVVILTNHHIHSEPILVLRWQDGQIYGYDEVGRGMLILKADGTSHWSNGAFYNGTHRDWYVPSGDGPDRREELLLSELVGDKFYLDGREVSQSEYEAAQANQNAKPNARWYYFNTDNIFAVFSPQIGGTS